MPEFQHNPYFQDKPYCRPCFDRLKDTMKMRLVIIDWCDRCQYHRILIEMRASDRWHCAYCAWWDSERCREARQALLKDKNGKELGVKSSGVHADNRAGDTGTTGGAGVRGVGGEEVAPRGRGSGG